MELGYSQRTISPYASPPITLLLGPPSDAQARYTVPRSLLTAFPTSQVVHSHHPCESILPLPDVSPDIGHTLVHYLHTGQYETLAIPSSSSSNSPSYDCHLEYQRAIHTYSTAHKYSLSELASLAQGHVVRFSTLLPAQQILNVVREVYPTLIDDAWFRVYMESIVINACRDDSGFLVSDGFLSAFGKGEDIRFDRFMMQIALDVAVKMAREKEENGGKEGSNRFRFRDFRENGNSNQTPNGYSHSNWHGAGQEQVEDVPEETPGRVDEGIWEHVEQQELDHEPQDHDQKHELIHDSQQPESGPDPGSDPGSDPGTSPELEPKPEPQYEHQHQQHDHDHNLGQDQESEPGQDQDQEQEQEYECERDPVDCYGPVKEPVNGIVPEDRPLGEMDRPVREELVLSDAEPELGKAPEFDTEHELLDRSAGIEPELELEPEPKHVRWHEHEFEHERSEPDLSTAPYPAEPKSESISKVVEEHYTGGAALPAASPVIEATPPAESSPEPESGTGLTMGSPTQPASPASGEKKKKKKNKKKKNKKSATAETVATTESVINGVPNGVPPNPITV